MMHGDAHPGNFMLMPDGKMGVIDFGAVAPLPGGLPIEIGLSTRYALNEDYDNLLATMQKIGFIQKGEQVSKREMDDMMKQYVEPLEVEVFHYTRKWLQRMTAMNMTDRAAGQIKAARQMDLPAKLAIPMRVIASNVAIACQLDAHIPVKSACHRTDSGFRRRSGLTGYFALLACAENPAALCGCRALHGVLAWPSTRTLARDDRAALDDLAAPNTPRLLAFQRRVEALAADRAIRAQRLGALEVERVFGEPQIGVTDMTRHRQHRSLTACH